VYRSLPLFHAKTHIRSRAHGCQGEFWKFNPSTQQWDGNPVFDPDYKFYFELLKNRDKRTGTSTQALPILPKDLKVIVNYLNSQEAIDELSETKCLYFKAFATTAFTLWTRYVSFQFSNLRSHLSSSTDRNDELINLQVKDIQRDCVSLRNCSYHDITLVFCKTNKDPTKDEQ
jgi:hypothetical protein